jgi:hypothetical protein
MRKILLEYFGIRSINDTSSAAYSTSSGYLVLSVKDDELERTQN